MNKQTPFTRADTDAEAGPHVTEEVGLFAVPPAPDEALDAAAMRKAVDGALRALPEEERRVLQLRFGLDEEEPKSSAETGRILGLTERRVSQIEARALRRLRHPRNCNPLKAFRE